jgi:phosphoesterase RecJ-like protein
MPKSFSLLDFNALHRTWNGTSIGDPKSAIYNDRSSSKPDDYATFTYSDTSWNLRNDLQFHFSSWEYRQNYWNLYLHEFLPIQVLFVFKTTGTTHRIAELIDLGVENTEIPTLLTIVLQ